MGKRTRYSATFAKSKGPFIDRNPKGGKKRSGMGETRLRPPAPVCLAMTLIKSKTTVFGPSHVSERSLEWLAGSGVKDEFGLKGAERGERGGGGGGGGGGWREEIAQPTGSRKTTDARFLEISTVLGW